MKKTAALLSAVLLGTQGCGNQPETTNTTTASPTITLTSSSPPASAPPPVSVDGLTDVDRQNLQSQVFTFLNGLFMYREGNTNRYCNEWFIYGEPRIVDTMVSGNSGQIVVVTPITQNVKFQGYAPSAYGNRCHQARNQPLGVTVDVREEFRVERWDSGWKLVLEQKY